MAATRSCACQACATSGRCICASAPHSKNGISLHASTSTKPSAYGSCVLCQGGGASSVQGMVSAQGRSSANMSRTSQPEGASKSTQPSAKATCGKASMAGKNAAGSRCARSPSPVDRRQALAASASRVAATPLHSDKTKACANCGCCSNSAQAVVKEVRVEKKSTNTCRCENSDCPAKPCCCDTRRLP